MASCVAGLLVGGGAPGQLQRSGSSREHFILEELHPCTPPPPDAAAPGLQALALELVCAAGDASMCDEHGGLTLSVMSQPLPLAPVADAQPAAADAADEELYGCCDDEPYCALVPESLASGWSSGDEDEEAAAAAAAAAAGGGQAAWQHSGHVGCALPAPPGAGELACSRKRRGSCDGSTAGEPAAAAASPTWGCAGSPDSGKRTRPGNDNVLVGAS